MDREFLITIYRAGGTWIADMSRSRRGREMKRLLGTTQVPTPYRDQTNGATVALALITRNPGHTIIFWE